jgi:hypothetical protein
MPITINGTGTVTGISAGGLPDSCITTDDIAANAVTAAKLGADQASGLAKAWVNFDGTANTNLSGTYSQSGTTVTVTATAHGLLTGSSINVDATSGTAVDGIYTVVTVTNANTFTYTAGTSLTTSGNITLLRNTIRASFNVSSITDNGTGDYTVNFTTAMVNANYAISFCASQDAVSGTLLCTSVYSTGGVTTSGVRLSSGHYGGGTTNYRDVDQGHVAVFR